KLVPKPSYTLTVHVPAQDYPLAQLLFPKLGWSYERQKPDKDLKTTLSAWDDVEWPADQTLDAMLNDI
ncbi:MAG: hypothetical protein ACFCUI_11725, partial [Bernardetiaceae bacterium]